MLKWILGALVLGFLGAAAYIRTAPLPASQLAPRSDLQGMGSHPKIGGHRVELPRPTDTEMAALNDAILSTPRTTQLERFDTGGGVFVSRSLIWGFPDITHVVVTDDTLVIDSHLVFGRSDLGVNKARIEGWLAAMAAV